MIELKNVWYAHGGRPAIEDVSLKVGKGEIVAIIGPNASGKTTLARMMNALLVPQAGDCKVDGISTREDPMYARKAVGMVFQDPENQAVARHVMDDIAFGPKNLGLPADEVERRVKVSLEAVGIYGLYEREVSGLSGGQKQLLAIAGTLAMRPSYIVLDEPASFLDGKGAKAVRDTMVSLKRNGMGVVVITHDMDEASLADRIVVLDNGRIVADSSPRAIFSDERSLACAGMEPPYAFRLSKELEAVDASSLFEEAMKLCR